MGAMMQEHPNHLWTVGHSTLPIEDFIQLLVAQRIEAVADVRRFPASRRHPHFNAAALHKTLTKAGIAYYPFPDLGGRRPPRPDSANTVWRNTAFRGYADYMETQEFREATQRLKALASEFRTSILCAEAVWWRCHRALIADYFKASGWEVFHIQSRTSAPPHPYTQPAHAEHGVLTYVEASPLP
jgi:uncharacterized protein (DUF488 family)